MNNRYIFKGKRKDNGEWVTGYYVRNGEHCYIFSGKLGIINKHFNWERYEVIPETVRQCTGKKDKDGMWIFEGDICSLKYCRDNYVGRIVFDDKAAAFVLQYNSTVGAYGEQATHRPLIMHCNDVKIIGSIHDNPELLEVER